MSKEYSSNFPNPFNLETLDGNNGFFVPGLETEVQLGWSVAVGGDINGDNKMDFALSARNASPDNKNHAGEVYVIFGSESKFPTPFNLTTLNGTNGFRIPGTGENDHLTSVAIGGDINGDGLADLVLGANEASPNSKQYAGKVYIIFGASKFPRKFDLNILNGDNGFGIPGILPGDNFGRAVAIGGDINGDGKSDFVLSANAAAGVVYAIFGTNSTFPSAFNLNTLNGKNGFEIPGKKEGGHLGTSLSIGGDINNDGKADIILGSQYGDNTYVIFGSELPFNKSFNLGALDGMNGFEIPNVVNGEYVGASVSIGGDINNDGIDDVAMGSIVHSVSKQSDAYVIFGKESQFNKAFNLTKLDGTNGFKITGLVMGYDSGMDFGQEVALGGDINGDGNDDLILGSPDTCSQGKKTAGEVYVILGGRSSFPSSLNVTTLNGENGFVIPGLLPADKLGESIAIGGNVNKDGEYAFIIGSKFITFSDSPVPQSGKAYVVFSSSNVENYGMLSYTDHFKPINSSSNAGMVNIGSTGQWCNSKLLHTGDFNGDTMSDLLCNMKAQNSIMLAKHSDSDVIFTSINNDPNGKIKIGVNDKWCDNTFQEMLTGDFNADNKTDLLCRSVQGQDSGQNYVMLSNGTGFNPMASNSDGKVKVGQEGKFCSGAERLIVGDFDGKGADDLLCNDPNPMIGNMIMIPNGTDFISINSDVFGRVSMGNKTECYIDWCQEAGSVLRTGDFNADGKSDLLCNFQGKNMMMLSSIGASWPCDFKPITSNGKTSSDGYLPIGQNQQWCDTSKFKLLVEDVNGDQMADLVCNARGSNKIMLCQSDGADGYQFKSINATNPEGQVYMGDHTKWCLSQNLFTGDYNGDTLGDLLCNQGGQVADHLDYGL